MMPKYLAILCTLVLSCVAQSLYVKRPTSYLVVNPGSTGIQNSGFGDRLSSSASSSTNQRYPFEALPNPALVVNLNKLPANQRPFWLQNWPAVEEQRMAAQLELTRSLCLWHWFKAGYIVPKGFCLLHWFK